jgi:hypothetical protein
MKIVRETLKGLELGSPTTFASLTMFPLLGGSGKPPEYATLDEAIRDGLLEVREVSQAGSVPELTIVNKGDRAVFLLDGEELVGAKQNRVLNLTILVPAGRTLVVPVSCVEQGRWASRSAVMSGSGSALYAKLRRMKMASVSRSYAVAGSPRSDQGEVWDEISSKMSDLSCNSPTAAMSDLFAREQKRTSDFVSAFKVVEGQRGAVFAIGDKLAGFELFEHPDVLRKMLEKIVRSYALDAIEVRETEALPTSKAVRAFVDEVADGRYEAFPGVGLGEDVRITGDRVTGAALVANDRVVHLCAFRNEDEAAGPGPRSRWTSRLTRASRRGR